MKTLEYNHKGQWRGLGDLYDKLLNSSWFCIDHERISSNAEARGYICSEDGRWHDTPRYCGTVSLFYNARHFWRKVYVGKKLRGRFWSFRWSGSTTEKAFIQWGWGIKLNGRFAFLLRVQSDETGARGTHGPNSGQAQGWVFGPH